MKFVLSEEMINRIVNYIGQTPWNQANALLQALQEELNNQPQETPPKDKK